MGKLRTEPKKKPFLSDRDYKHYITVLRNAQSAATDNHVFWDLDSVENPNQVRKAFLHIAEKEGIQVAIRRERGSQSLVFNFRLSQGKTSPARMSAAECQKRIMSALASANRPLQKSEIITATGISPSTWNVRIKELMHAGKVIRRGERRDTKYCPS